MGLREVYRVPYRELADREVAIVLETDGGERFDAEIIDLSIKGVGTRFEGRGRPDLDLRDEVIIEITMSGWEQPSRIPAILRSAFQAPGWCRYGFEFTGGELPARGLARSIYRWLDRRSPAGAGAADLPIEVCFERSSEGPVKGSMVNLCSGGASVEVACSEGFAPTVGTVTTIVFALAEDTEPISLHAEIQGCESNGSEVTLVLQFRGPFDPDAKELVDRYVIDRLMSQA